MTEGKHMSTASFRYILWGIFFYNLLTGEVLGCILIYFPHLCFAYVSYLKGTAKLSHCFLPAIALSGCSSDFSVMIHVVRLCLPLKLPSKWYTGKQSHL